MVFLSADSTAAVCSPALGQIVCKQYQVRAGQALEQEWAKLTLVI